MNSAAVAPEGILDLAYSNAQQIAEESDWATGQTRVVDGVGLFYRERGSGHPVLMLHGIPTSSFIWRDVAPVTALKSRVIAPDLPGFGRSEKPSESRYTVVRAADTVLALLDALEIDQFALVGHDFGALVATELLTRVPERVSHLVLTNTSLRLEGWTGRSPLGLLSIPGVGELAMAIARRWMLWLAMTVYVSRRERLNQETMDGYWEPFEHGYKQTLLRLFRSRPFTADDFSRWRRALEQLAVPCLIVWGSRDPSFTLADAEELERMIPNARLVSFTNANHFIQEDRPLALGRLIGSFVNEPARR